MVTHENHLKPRIKYVYSFVSPFVILIFTGICTVSDDFWKVKKNPIYVGTAANDIRKLILITKVNTTNNKLMFSYLISSERINSYAFILLLLSLMCLCQFLLQCLLFLGVLMY